MIRKSIIQRNINTSEIYHVIWHNGSIFFSLFFKYFLTLVVFVLIYLLLDRYILWEYLIWIFSAIGLIAFIKFCIDFFNLYLDSLVMTENWVILYLWEWLLEYKTKVFDRERVETISHNQNGIWDKIFFRWDIMIRLEHGVEFPFENVSHPKKQAAKILQLKNRFSYKKETDEIEETDNKKFDILVEALWEVVKDYIYKKNEDEYNN